MNDKIKDPNLIAFCGLYCIDCHGYNGKVPDLARDLRKELREVHYDKFAGFISTYSFGKDFKKYDECYKVLGAMVKFRCRKGCRGGGGSPFCQIRKCAQKKQIDGLRFRRQHSFGKYVLDFYCPEVKLATELDDEDHIYPGQRTKDFVRDEF